MFTSVFSHSRIGTGHGSERAFQRPRPCFGGTERGSCTVTSTNCRQFSQWCELISYVQVLTNVRYHFGSLPKSFPLQRRSHLLTSFRFLAIICGLPFA